MIARCILFNNAIALSFVRHLEKELEGNTKKLGMISFMRFRFFAKIKNNYQLTNNRGVFKESLRH